MSVSSAPADASIGFIGLGRMGLPMASNLAAAGNKVIAYNRHPERHEALAAAGLTPTEKLGDLFSCGLVVSMVSDNQAATEIVFGQTGAWPWAGLAAGLRKGAVHLSMSTIGPDVSTRLAAEHARHDQGYVAAPVFGNPDAAKAHELVIVAAGTAELLQRCEPVFAALGTRTFVVGAAPASANLIKIAGNAMLASTLATFGEVLAFVRKSGIEPTAFYEIMTSSLFGGRAHKIYGARMVAEDFAPGFTFPLALKDLTLVLAAAQAAAVPMPSISVVRDRLLAAIAQGYGDLDWS
ncbi:MAG: NAD(P)-dependent oxidoreductase, partial [Rhizobiales bacterium]|nr:NAD(P)-dependent oxidoreductase [Hyphomicrobiales bacterium]